MIMVDEEVEFGVIEEIRLILGDENSVVSEGQTFDLHTPKCAYFRS